MQDFDPYIWRERRRQRLEDYENLRRTVLSEVEEAVKGLTGKYEWDEIYLFGSITKSGRFQPNSDVDIGIKGLDKFALYAFIGDISVILNREVDVVRLEECPFAEKIMKSGVKWNPGKKLSSF